MWAPRVVVAAVVLFGFAACGSDESPAVSEPTDMKHLEPESATAR